jgi:hypothetical protein
MVMACEPTGVPPVRRPGLLHAVMAVQAARDAMTMPMKGQFMREPLRLRRARIGMNSARRPASEMTPTLLEDAEAILASPGAVVCTVSLEVQAPPSTVAGENVQVVLAGSCGQLSVTGRLNPDPGVILAV